MPRIVIQTEDFDIGAETTALINLAGTATGGIGSFIGIVRADPGQNLTALTLEHYPGMTEAAMTRIAETAALRWSLTGCTLIHRVGRLTPGARIVLVLTAAPHRAAALEATSFLIDWLKTRAPFWKKEGFADGSAAWVASLAEDEAAADRW